MSREQIESTVLAAVDEVNLTLPENMKLEPTPDAVVFGRGGKLDSLGLVNFILAVEERLYADLAMEVSLADERAMSQTRSPFRSISSLVDYIQELCNERVTN